MKRIAIFLWLLLTFLSAQALAQRVPPELISYPDMILHNGKIVTMDDETTSTNPGTIVQALAIRDGKILGTGNNKAILGLKGPQTKIINLKGRAVVPGIVDTHSHLFDYALDRYGKGVLDRTRLRADSGETWESIKQKTLKMVGEKAAKKKPGEWISLDLPRQAIGKDGKSEDGVQAARRGFITRSDLDKAAPNNPVHLKVRTRAIVNSKARDLVLKIWHGPQEPELIRDDGYASNTLNRVIPTDFMIRDLETLAQIYKKEQLGWAGYGVTTWSSSMRSQKALAAYMLLDKRGEMGIRFAYGPSLGTPLQIVPQMYGVSGYGTDYLWFLGASTRGVDSSYPGLSTTIQTPDIPKEIKDREILNSDFLPMIEDAVASGLRFTNTHIAGDQTLDLVLETLEKASKRAGLSVDQIRAKRHASDHCTMNPRPDQIPKLKNLGIIVSCAPKYIEATSPRALRDYGEKYVDWVAPVKSLINAGVRTVLEIDDRNIDEHGTVFYYLDLLVNREVEGKIYAGKERINRVLALKMSTTWAAEYVEREKVLGSLEHGKFADLLVLNSDYFTVPEKEIKKVKPLLTIVGGKIVFQDKNF
jgi:predicted amidohydrolase YtcJ